MVWNLSCPAVSLGRLTHTLMSSFIIHTYIQMNMGEARVQGTSTYSYIAPVLNSFLHFYNSIQQLFNNLVLAGMDWSGDQALKHIHSSLMPRNAELIITFSQIKRIHGWWHQVVCNMHHVTIQYLHRMHLPLPGMCLCVHVRKPTGLQHTCCTSWT